VVIAQGEIRWADLGEPIGSAPGYRRPVRVVQCDAINASRIATAGEWGMVVHSNCAYRGPAFTGDLTICNATVIDKLTDDQGRSIVKVDFKMVNQLNITMATANAEIELPTK
jgi:hypothetical protein